MAAPRLAAAAHLAKRFAVAYAASAYLRRPPGLPGTTALVRRDIALAAARVPPGRRRRRPHLRALALQPQGASALSASARIADGRFPPFSVGFTIRRVGDRWRVIAISPPG